MDFCGLCGAELAVGQATKMINGVEYCASHSDDVLPIPDEHDDDGAEQWKD